MKQVNLYEAKTHLSSLVEEAAAGEEVIIAKNGKPCARLVALDVASDVKPRRREFGQWGRKYGYVAPDVFPETTAEEIALWEDGPVFPPDDPA
ncbi:MAG: type II toxin-antitoxin system Phd/YefM family antitoxin [Alphaproteobacteria bacterium]